MKPKAKIFLDHKIIPLASVSRIERWHVCQQIGVIFYDSELPVDELLKIKDNLKQRGIINL